MLEAERDGTAIMAPKYAESVVDGQKVSGVGWVRLEPGDPDYAVWDRHLRELERAERRPSWSSRVAAGLDPRRRGR